MADVVLTPVDHDPFAESGTALVPVDHDPFAPQVDWSHLNQPTGSLAAIQYTPSQRLGNAAQDALTAAGAQPYVARHLVEGVGGLLGMTPAAVPVAAADLIDAKSRGDIGGAVHAAAAMIPGAGPVSRDVFPVVESQAERAFRTGFDHIAHVDAPALKEALEKTLGEPLVWSEGKLKAHQARGWASGYPRLGVYQNRVGIEDGRHRIAAAAERGQAIDVAVSSPEEKAYLESAFGPNQPIDLGDR